jgi:hypothetical protein
VPSEKEVVHGLRQWLDAVMDHAATLEAEVERIVRADVDLVELGAKLQGLVPRVVPPSATGAGETSLMLMHRMVRGTTSSAPPVVWLLGRVSGGTLSLYEQYTTGTPTNTRPVTFSDVGGKWAERSDGVWQRLHYADREAETFELCFFWHGDEKVTVSSGGEPWVGQPWLGDDGEVGMKFCKTFAFSNLTGRTITIEVKLPNGTSETFTVRIDNANAGNDDDDKTPKPILIPVEQPIPPEGPGPSVIPDDFTSLPGIDDPRTVRRVIDLFVAYRDRVEASMPAVVREVMTPAQLFENPGAVQHLIDAAAASLER